MCGSQGAVLPARSKQAQSQLIFLYWMVEISTVLQLKAVYHEIFGSIFANRNRYGCKIFKMVRLSIAQQRYCTLRDFFCYQLSLCRLTCRWNPYYNATRHDTLSTHWKSPAEWYARHYIIKLIYVLYSWVKYGVRSPKFIWLLAIAVIIVIGWDPATTPSPAFGFIYEGAIGQPR